MKYAFGDIVVVNGEDIGVIVKCWISSNHTYNYDVYVRNYNGIENYKEEDIQRYMVRHKYLSDEEKIYQHNVINGLYKGVKNLKKYLNKKISN